MSRWSSRTNRILRCVGRSRGGFEKVTEARRTIKEMIGKEQCKSGIYLCGGGVVRIGAVVGHAYEGVEISVDDPKSLSAVIPAMIRYCDILSRIGKLVALHPELRNVARVHELALSSFMLREFGNLELESNFFQVKELLRRCDDAVDELDSSTRLAASDLASRLATDGNSRGIARRAERFASMVLLKRAISWSSADVLAADEFGDDEKVFYETFGNPLENERAVVESPLLKIAREWQSSRGDPRKLRGL